MNSSKDKGPNNLDRLAALLPDLERRLREEGLLGGANGDDEIAKLMRSITQGATRYEETNESYSIAVTVTIISLTALKNRLIMLGRDDLASLVRERYFMLFARPKPEQIN